jgi:hypothetical protein
MHKNFSINLEQIEIKMKKTIIQLYNKKIAVDRLESLINRLTGEFNKKSYKMIKKSNYSSLIYFII